MIYLTNIKREQEEISWLYRKKYFLGESAYATIECAKRVDRLTNTSYDVAARKADERIEQNNREYAATYKRAALFSAK